MRSNLNGTCASGYSFPAEVADVLTLWWGNASPPAKLQWLSCDRGSEKSMGIYGEILRRSTPHRLIHRTELQPPSIMFSLTLPTSIFWFYFVSRRCLAFQPVCNVGIYGLPNHGDCITAFQQIPFALAPAAYSAGASVLYSEPQFLRPPFTAVSNRYAPRPINQLPKIWRYSMLIFYILPLGVSLV